VGKRRRVHANVRRRPIHRTVQSCSLLNSRTLTDTGSLDFMSAPPVRRREIMRLFLQIERDAVAQTHLKTLLTVANATIADHRQELRMARAQLTPRSAARRAQSASAK
jgi:hypothetical protein